MEQNPTVIDADFKKRRNQKNWVVMSLILGCVALIWAVTMLKFNPSVFQNFVHPAQQAETINEGAPATPEGGKDAQ